MCNHLVGKLKRVGKNRNNRIKMQLSRTELEKVLQIQVMKKILPEGKYE